MHIIYAKSDKQIDAVRELFQEYESFLGLNLDFQDFERELASLPGKYTQPDGALFLAVNHGQAIGCGALRRFGEIGKNVCEMKRLFVRQEARGQGTGRKLALKIIEEAVHLGYSSMVLDTLERLNSAMKLYESMGFVTIQPYYDNPLSGVVYLKKELQG